MNKKVIAYEYAYYGITKLDKAHFRKQYMHRYHNVRVKRVRTDVKGLKMYEIYVLLPDNYTPLY